MGYKVLIAEDDRHTRTILEHIFTKDPAFKDQEIELLLASDGEQALSYFKSHDPDLIISDLLMPKVDGFAFCRTVRKTPKGKNLPLVITSAIYKETALLNRLREELNVTFFPKPFQVREFTKEISRMMNLENSDSIEPEEKEFVDRVTMSQPFKGKLQERSMPSLLLDIQNIEGTGVLKLERGKIKKEIFFLFGRPVGAESNIRHENLGNYLVSKNIISKEQHHKLLSSARENHISFLKALMELNKFDESLVLKYHSSLVKVRIVNAFKWHKGEYSFLPGDSFSDRIIKAPVDPIALVFAGLKRITDLDTITDKLQDDITSLIKITKRGEKHKSEFQRIFGAKIYDEIENNKTSLGELLGKGIDPMTLYTHIFVMAETGMIEFKKQENAKDESLNLSMLEDPLNLSNLKKAAAPSKNPEEEISIVANVPAPESEEEEESGLILDLPIEVDDEEDKKLINQLKKFYLDIHEKDFFEILGVDKDASQKEIDSAFAVLQSQFSYDMFEDVDLGSDHAKLEEISEFLKIAKETLSDPVKRKRYKDQNLKQKKKGASFVEAEVYAKKAEQALNQDNKSVALKNIDKAIEVEPDIGDYHAIKAKIMQSKGQPTEKVISTLETALELDPESVIINFTAAEIFKSMDKMDRAINLYQKVLENRPEHKEAFAKLEKIFTEKGAWRILERLHRKLLHLCGNRRPSRTVELALSLAKLYEKHLHDYKKAVSALEIVLSVQPHKGEVKNEIQRLKSIMENKSLKEKLSLEEIREALTKNPFESKLYLLGFNLKNNLSVDHKYLFAVCYMILNKKPDEAVANYYHRFKPPFLPRIWKKIDSEVWELIQDKEDCEGVGQIFEILGSNIPEISIADINYKSEKQIEFQQLPTKLKNILEYIAYEISIPIPDIHIDNNLDAPALGEFENKMVIFTPIDFLDQKDPFKISANLIPLLASFWTGRALPGILSAKELLTILKTILDFLSGKNSTNNHQHLMKELNKTSKKVKRELGRAFKSVSEKKGNINISKWARGVNRSTQNLNLLLTQNLSAVYHSIDNRADQGNLLYYAVSDRFIELRKLVGCSIHVPLK